MKDGTVVDVGTPILLITYKENGMENTVAPKVGVTQQDVETIIGGLVLQNAALSKQLEAAMVKITELTPKE